MNRILGIGCSIFIFLLAACGANEINTDSSNEVEAVTNEGNEQESGKETANETEQHKTANDEYPMPILAGWVEEEIVFETIGGGAIDVWHGEFSFAEEIDDYFVPYQSALIDMGFEVTITQDVEGMKTLEITKVIDGDKHVGNVLFTDHWVKSSLQHFK